MNALRSVFAVATLVLLGFGVGAAPADAGQAPIGIGADVSDFVFESFDGQYFLSADDESHARLRVVETLVAVFPSFDQNRGIVREIPRSYREAPLGITIESVTDADGRAVPFEIENVDDYVQLALGTDDYVHGRQTYVIQYTANDVIGYFDDSQGDEFFWDINGTGWGQPFARVSADIHVDASLASALTGHASCYRGEYGSNSRCDIGERGTAAPDGSVDFSVQVPEMAAGQNVSVAIGFTGGTVAQPTIPAENWIVAVLPLLLTALALLLVLFALFLRFVVLRDARGRGLIIPEYSVPRELDPLLAGVITGRVKPSMPAQFVSLAVNRIVDVVDRTPESGKDDGRYDLVLRSTAGATKRELAFLLSLFGTDYTEGARVRVDRFSQKAGARLYAHFTKARTEAKKRGLTAVPTTPLSAIVSWGGPAIVIAHVLTLIWAIVTQVDPTALIFLGFASLVLTIVATVIASVPARLTPKGAELREYLLGVRDYLQLAEADRMRVLQSPAGALRAVDVSDSGAIVKLHEKLLPFAILFSVEKQWAKQLEFDYANAGETPTWTSGRTSGNLVGVLSGISLGSASVRPLVSTSGSSGGSSSSFSGSSGGGFSGGGGGGGGGGGR